MIRCVDGIMVLIFGPRFIYQDKQDLRIRGRAKTKADQTGLIV